MNKSKSLLVIGIVIALTSTTLSGCLTPFKDLDELKVEARIRNTDNNIKLYTAISQKSLQALDFDFTIESIEARHKSNVDAYYKNMGFWEILKTKIWRIKPNTAEDLFFSQNFKLLERDGYFEDWIPFNLTGKIITKSNPIFNIANYSSGIFIKDITDAFKDIERDKYPNKEVRWTTTNVTVTDGVGIVVDWNGKYKLIGVSKATANSTNRAQIIKATFTAIPILEDDIEDAGLTWDEFDEKVKAYKDESIDAFRDRIKVSTGLSSVVVSAIKNKLYDLLVMKTVYPLLNSNMFTRYFADILAEKRDELAKREWEDKVTISINNSKQFTRTYKYLTDKFGGQKITWAYRNKNNWEDAIPKHKNYNSKTHRITDPPSTISYDIEAIAVCLSNKGYWNKDLWWEADPSFPDELSGKWAKDRAEEFNKHFNDDLLDFNLSDWNILDFGGMPTTGEAEYFSINVAAVAGFGNATNFILGACDPDRITDMFDIALDKIDDWVLKKSIENLTNDLLDKMDELENNIKVKFLNLIREESGVNIAILNKPAAIWVLPDDIPDELLDSLGENETFMSALLQPHYTLQVIVHNYSNPLNKSEIFLNWLAIEGSWSSSSGSGIKEVYNSTNAKSFNYITIPISDIPFTYKENDVIDVTFKATANYVNDTQIAEITIEDCRVRVDPILNIFGDLYTKIKSMLNAFDSINTTVNNMNSTVNKFIDKVNDITGNIGFGGEGERYTATITVLNDKLERVPVLLSTRTFKLEENQTQTVSWDVPIFRDEEYTITITIKDDEGKTVAEDVQTVNQKMYSLWKPDTWRNWWDQEHFWNDGRGVWK